MTDGILWRELIKDPCLTDYFCVVLDEAHMRTINSDLLLAALKTTVEKRRDFRLIVCRLVHAFGFNSYTGTCI